MKRGRAEGLCIRDSEGEARRGVTRPATATLRMAWPPQQPQAPPDAGSDLASGEGSGKLWTEVSPARVLIGVLVCILVATAVVGLKLQGSGCRDRVSGLESRVHG
jgi:hypothetical protein